MNPIRRVTRLQWAVLALWLAVFLSYFWFSTNGTFHRIRKENAVFYEWLSDGFLHGQLSLLQPVDTRLLTMPDPYDPKANEPIRFNAVSYDNQLFYTHDISYFEGRYYVYFGAAPALLFYIPIKIITGRYPPPELATALFFSLSFLFLALILASVVTTPVSRSTAFLFICLLAGLGWGTGIPDVIGRSAAYEVAISFCVFLDAAALFIFLCITRDWGRENKFRLIMLGFTLGLIPWSRPNESILIPFFLAAVLMKFSKRDKIKALITTAVPLAFLGTLLTAYNFARFKNVTEFGAHFQLSGLRPSELLCTNHGLQAYFRCLGLITRSYLFNQPYLVHGFPYVTNGAPPNVNLGFHYDHEWLTGVFWMAPVLFISSGILIFAVYKSLRDGALFRQMRSAILENSAVITAIESIVVLSSLGVIAAAMLRFVSEVSGLVYTVGALVILKWWPTIRGGQRAVFFKFGILVLVGGVTLWSLVCGFMLGIQGEASNFAYTNPAQLESIKSLLRSLLGY